MQSLYFSIIIVTFLPLLWTILGDVIRMRLPEGLDNQNVRQQISGLTGLGARVYGAHQNAWEAIALFIPCVFLAQLTGTDLESIGFASLIYAALRCAHGVAYCMDWATLRSTIWIAGLGCLIWILSMSFAG